MAAMKDGVDVLAAKMVDVGGREQLAVRYLSMGSQKPGTTLRFPPGVATSPDPFSPLILSHTPRCGGEAEALGINSSASPQIGRPMERRRRRRHSLEAPRRRETPQLRQGLAGVWARLGNFTFSTGVDTIGLFFFYGNDDNLSVARE
jgi:hypothetical protein